MSQLSNRSKELYVSRAQKTPPMTYGFNDVDEIEQFKASVFKEIDVPEDEWLTSSSGSDLLGIIDYSLDILKGLDINGEECDPSEDKKYEGIDTKIERFDRKLRKAYFTKHTYKELLNPVFKPKATYSGYESDSSLSHFDLSGADDFALFDITEKDVEEFGGTRKSAPSTSELSHDEPIEFESDKLAIPKDVEEYIDVYAKYMYEGEAKGMKPEEIADYARKMAEDEINSRQVKESKELLPTKPSITSADVDKQKDDVFTGKKSSHIKSKSLTITNNTKNKNYTGLIKSIPSPSSSKPLIPSTSSNNPISKVPTSKDSLRRHTLNNVSATTKPVITAKSDRRKTTVLGGALSSTSSPRINSSTPIKDNRRHGIVNPSFKPIQDKPIASTGSSPIINRSRPVSMQVTKSANSSIKSLANLTSPPKTPTNHNNAIKVRSSSMQLSSSDIPNTTYSRLNKPTTPPKTLTNNTSTSKVRHSSMQISTSDIPHTDYGKLFNSTSPPKAVVSAKDGFVSRIPKFSELPQTKRQSFIQSHINKNGEFVSKIPQPPTLQSSNTRMKYASMILPNNTNDGNKSTLSRSTSVKVSKTPNSEFISRIPKPNFLVNRRRQLQSTSNITEDAYIKEFINNIYATSDRIHSDPKFVSRIPKPTKYT